MRAPTALKAQLDLQVTKARKAAKADKALLVLLGRHLQAQEAHKAIPDLIALQGPKG